MAYVIGLALGDGNLSNPNGRAIRLRITCDTKYPHLEKQIESALKKLFPKSKVSKVRRAKTYEDISVYSNELATLLPWTVGRGSKLYQRVSVPTWIQKNKMYVRACLRGLLQTDGSIYRDRGYLMVNFTNNASQLCKNVFAMMQTLGFRPTFHTTTKSGKNTKYTVRLARNTKEFIDEIKLTKS